MILVKIGKHVFEVKRVPVRLMDFFHRNFLLAAKSNLPDLTIKLEEGYGVPFVNFDVDITIEPNQISYRRADYLIEVDREFKMAGVYVHDELALKHALMNLYSSFIVHRQWGLLIHSSCVLDKGKAHLFAGQSGAGKSTAARLSHPRELLSDEATIVNIHSSGSTVFDSPFRSEVASAGTEAGRPLESIQLLVQARHHRQIRLNKSDALLRLIDKVFYWPHCPEETSCIIAFLKTLVETVPVYELHFQKDAAFWGLIS